MTEEDRKALTELIFRFTAEALALRCALAVINQEIPDFKNRVIGMIRQVSSSVSAGQAMIDEAVKIIADLDGS